MPSSNHPGNRANHMDQRKQQLLDWLQTIGIRTGSIEPASADASFRRYFRLSGIEPSLIVMDAPPEKEDSRPFVRIAVRLRALGLNVPQILEQDLEQGFLLLSDLGDRTYLEALNGENVERLYGDAMEALIVLQLGTRTDPDFLPVYDRPLLENEMQLFPEWLLERHLGQFLGEEQRQGLQRCFDVLVDNALEQPAVWVHRDYHSRNLMVLDQQNPGILDFQDAVLGPVTYDLVSLLRDCYVDWPPDQVYRWAKVYRQRALDSGLLMPGSEEQFRRWFDLMGVQRHLKAAGIFARLYHRDGKPGYLADIPRTLGYISGLRDRYPELLPLVDIVDSMDFEKITSTVAG